ncbi:DUF5018 domain-containing protein [Flavivirga eckloniae]|uniref:PKD domain-containing protein n=1 Tax=Flavivirga eckloniae TaxID=1803846 RepID=A0A2K9PND8_9FLAO|nr:DUF5018 domain-containing protein [Flavivirga eckloniae]AUP78546.1 hypothetical protein C1H87_07405 [Flavivirga eckloniae]
MNIFRIPLITLLLMFIVSCSKEDVKRSNAKELTSFIINDVKATVNQQNKTLEITLSAGTDKTSLKAEVELSDKATISPDPVVARDYTNPVEFTVTAEDGSTQKYTVMVTVLSNANAITKFIVNDVAGNINENDKTITLKLPSGTNVAALSATTEIADKATIMPDPAVARDYTNPVEFTVTAEDDSTQKYTVMVTVLSNANAITKFIVNDVAGNINENDKTITLKLPSGTNVTALSATTEIADKATITPDPAVARDYTNPVEFTVTAEDGSTQKYTVTVKNAPSTAFITTWKTTEANESILIPIFSGVDNNGEREEVYNYSVDWGDGSTDTNQTGSATHSYATAGTYTVSITGDFPRIYFPSDELGRFRLKIQSVENWGSQVWTSMNSAFSRCENLVVNAVDTPNLSKVTDMASMFFEATSFNQDISSWDVSNVTDMSFMFSGAINFNQDLSNWNVSKVTDMEDMLTKTNLSARHYENLLDAWSKLTLQKGVKFNVGNTTYCHGEAAKQKLINDFGWTITDGDKYCD